MDFQKAASIAAHGGRRSGRDYHRRRTGGRADPGGGPLPAYLRPENGAEVLVIKGGPGGQEQCVAGMRQAEAEEPMEPGEVLIRGGGASIYLKADGSLVLKGRVSVEGPLFINGEPYKPCTCGEEGTV